MIKIKAEIAGQSHEVHIQRNNPAVSAGVDGHVYELEVSSPAAGEYLIRHGTHVYNCRIEKTGKQLEDVEVHIRGTSYAIHLVDPKRLNAMQSAGEHDHGSARIIAPMPGKVVRVLVEIGKQVEAGAGIVVVEAMKMQNEMKSPKSGVVVSLNAETGATVNAGDVLAEIE